MEHGETATGMPRRLLGATGEEVSLIGIGGSHLGTGRVGNEEAIAIVRRAIDRGINFMDNSWDYHGGESERRMGRALADGYRKRAFLMTKVDGRTREAAERQLEESLRRLGTDFVDLVQHHEVIRFEDVDRIFAEDGAHTALEAARQAGKVRYIGFTGHKDPQIHLRMLEVAEDYGFAFDTVQLPLNVMDAHFRSFEKDVVPRLVRLGTGILGMKSLANGIILESGTVTATECLHYVMNLPVSVVITGIDSLERLDQACDAARSFRPLSTTDLTELLARTAPVAMRGEFEPFKTSTAFDATAKNPEWLGPVSERVRELTSG